jgi:hypothetical protein
MICPDWQPRFSRVFGLSWKWTFRLFALNNTMRKVQPMSTLDILVGLFSRRGVVTRTVLLILAITVLGSFHSPFASSQESSLSRTMPLVSAPKNVLVLYSYHRAEWSDNVQKGIESVFAPYQNVNFFYEYMDTKRLKTKEYLETLRKIYTEKYNEAHIDLIFCVDNNA